MAAAALDNDISALGAAERGCENDDLEHYSAALADQFRSTAQWPTLVLCRQIEHCGFLSLPSSAGFSASVYDSVLNQCGRGRCVEHEEISEAQLTVSNCRDTTKTHSARRHLKIARLIKICGNLSMITTRTLSTVLKASIFIKSCRNSPSEPRMLIELERLTGDFFKILLELEGDTRESTDDALKKLELTRGQSDNSVVEPQPTLILTNCCGAKC